MKNNTKYIAIALLVFLTLIYLAPFAIAEDTLISGQQSTMEIKPNRFTVQKGEAFDIDLYVKLNAMADTIGVDHIDWDSAIATLDAVQPGDVFSEQTIWIGGKTIDNEKGTLDWMVWGSHTPSNGEGVFAKLKFTALKSGTFSIYIPQDKMMMAIAGDAVASTIIGEDSLIQKSTETFLPIGDLQINQTAVFIIGALIGLLVVSLVGIYLSKKKKNALQATTDDGKIEK